MPNSLTQQQKTTIITKLKEKKYIKAVREKGREYTINFIGNSLMRSLIQTLEKQGFIPDID